MINPLLNSKDVADLLACSIRTVEDQARSGALPAVKFGEGWMFPADALLRAVNRIAEEEAARRSKPAVPAAVKRAPVRNGPPNLSVLNG